MPLWASWLRDFDILNLFYDEFKSEKMAKFETLIAPRGLREAFIKKKKKFTNVTIGEGGVPATKCYNF